MGLMSKIAYSKIGRTGAILAGVGTVIAPVTYDILNPTAVYAQEQSQTAGQLVEQLANLPEQSVYAKRVVAKILINAYNTKKVYGEKRTENVDCSVIFQTKGYLNPNQRCVGIQELYASAKDKFGKKLDTKAKTNIGLSVLIERAADCGCK
ncbi:MAG: hypothetical protein U9R34_06285 [Nanoarchaeota archaeon]|nr:hypothetical protein [Nanoarchaeota archaeon]